MIVKVQRKSKKCTSEMPGPNEDGIYTICRVEGRTETQNAKRFKAQWGQDVRYCELWSKWLEWRGTHWQLDDCRSIDAKGKKVTALLWQQAKSMATKLKLDPEGDLGTFRAMDTFCRTSNSDRGLRAMLALARSESGIPILPSELDQDPWLLNVLNGTIDLRTGTLRAHDRDDRITKLARVRFDPEAECPEWKAFLNVVLPDLDCQAFVRRLVGYGLTGCTQEHVLPIAHGYGANGKSTFLNTILALLGTDYSMKAPTDLLLAKRNTSHPTELADLFGKRFVACIEAEDGRRLAESLVKELTGGDKIRARRMREDFWEFNATHKLWLATNHKPQVRGTDHGIWRRLKLIPFTVSIPEDKQDKELPDKLLGELPGVLNWALLGCQEWQQNGLGEPTAVQEATAEYRQEMDVLGDFIAECCVLRENITVGATPLFEAYKSWCESAGETAVTQRRFGMQLTERGFQNDRFSAGSQKGRMCWHGIGLLCYTTSEGW